VFRGTSRLCRSGNSQRQARQLKFKPNLFSPFFTSEPSRGPLFLAQKILALTKMNWNNTQFDNFEPITLKAACKVGSIFKYMKPTDPFQSRYSFYM
jgi:hypothetical protein